MLNLHLLRYRYSKVATFGILYAPDGWQCFTIEPHLATDGSTRVFRTALPGGTFQIGAPGGDKGIPAYPRLFNRDSEVVGFVSDQYNPQHLSGGIGITYGVRLEAGQLVPSSLALLHLIERLQSHPGASVTIAHLPELEPLNLAMRETVL
jgi:hypothetical protein